MNRKELIEALQAEELVDGEQQKVVIKTTKQLLPNASYEFELEVEDDYTIVLTPTFRK